ncbi:MAG: glycosyltransferase [Actinomycetota bacterium]|nr:glycosyltransferase [Actinomycetota bacterium]
MSCDVSVVICCYTLDRWRDLVAAIDSVLAQEQEPGSAPTELVVVVDHNPDLLDRLRDARPELTVVGNAATRGLSGARNTGLKLVASEVVAFLDDDARARPGWLAAHAAAYDDPRVLGVGGRLEPTWDTGRPGWFPHDFDWVVGCSHTGVPVSPAEIRNPIGANMSFRTDVLREAGGFSEDLGRVGTRPLGCEETEASIRVGQRRPGGVIWYVPDAVVDHRVTAERARWSYYRRRCWAEGWSKSTVRRLSQESLGAERDYATRILPRSFATAVRRGVTGDRDSLARAGAIAGGLGLTAMGYAAGHLSNRSGRLHRALEEKA